MQSIDDAMFVGELKARGLTLRKVGGGHGSRNAVPAKCTACDHPLRQGVARDRQNRPYHRECWADLPDDER